MVVLLERIELSTSSLPMTDSGQQQTRKFFLEAKRPKVDIKMDVAPAYQLRRYAWSSKLPLSILSDFEEFSIYDCRVRPNRKDAAANARIFYCTFDQYIEKWDEISGIFSRDAVLKGSFDGYAESTKGKKGTSEVDDAFLHEIERWRALLARNFALRNKQLTVRDLNFAVQKTIDRMIFLRICEDRGSEDYGRLAKLSGQKNSYRGLIDLFKRADARYNSGLFHFRDEKDRHDTFDALTPNLVLDDRVVDQIVANLYYPESPYEFSVLPADILGQVYEQFLGKTIRLTKGHQAKIEEKPAVRKAGGVTPYDKYKGHTPEQIQNKVFHENTQRTKRHRKLLKGNDVRRYMVKWNGETWIDYGTWLGAPRERRFFQENRILVKQIIDWSSLRIWAALTDEELYMT